MYLSIYVDVNVFNLQREGSRGCMLLDTVYKASASSVGGVGSALKQVKN